MASKQPRGHFKREPHLSIFSKKEDERVTQLIRKVLTNQRFCFGLMICDWSIGKTSGDVTRARQNSNYKSKCSHIFLKWSAIYKFNISFQAFCLILCIYHTRNCYLGRKRAKRQTMASERLRDSYLRIPGITEMKCQIKSNKTSQFQIKVITVLHSKSFFFYFLKPSEV